MSEYHIGTEQRLHLNLSKYAKETIVNDSLTFMDDKNIYLLF